MEREVRVETSVFPPGSAWTKRRARSCPNPQRNLRTGASSDAIGEEERHAARETVTVASPNPAAPLGETQEERQGSAVEEASSPSGEREETTGLATRGSIGSDGTSGRGSYGSRCPSGQRGKTSESPCRKGSPR